MRKKKAHPIERFPPGFYVMLAGAHLRGPFLTRKAAARALDTIMRDPLVLERVKPQITIELHRNE